MSRMVAILQVEMTETWQRKSCVFCFFLYIINSKKKNSWQKQEFHSALQTVLILHSPPPALHVLLLMVLTDTFHLWESVGGEPWPRRCSSIYQRQWLEEAILPLFILPRSVQFVCFHHPCGSTNRIWQIGLGTQCAGYLGPSQWMLICTKRKTARGLKGIWSVCKAGPKTIKMMIFWADLFTSRLPSVW